MRKYLLVSVISAIGIILLLNREMYITAGIILVMTTCLEGVCMVTDVNNSINITQSRSHVIWFALVGVASIMTLVILFMYKPVWLIYALMLSPIVATASMRGLLFTHQEN